MISGAELESWIALGESETLELKRSTGERREGVQTLCAMLNHRGGRLLFGVSPDGKLVGQQVTDRTLEELWEEIQRLDPPAFPAIERVLVGGGREALALSVTQGPVRPYSYKGVAYKRVGSTSPVMSRDEYNRILLERLHSEQRWENQPATGWSIEDLDLVEVRRTIEEAVRRGRAEEPGTREPAEILRGLGLLKDGALLRAAVVLFGRSERIEAELPHCLLRVGRFRGTDRTEFLDNRQIHGNAFDLLRQAERFLRDSLPIAGRVLPGSFERLDEPLYPPPALREALANAICHRDYGVGGGSVAVAIYDDRLEIVSAGSLHFGLTADALFKPHESLPWNPLIARVFYRCGIIEAWGRGTIKMVEQMRLAGLPAPEIEEVGGGVVVRFHSARRATSLQVGRQISERQSALLALLATSTPGLVLREIRSLLSLQATERQLRRDLEILRTAGLIVASGHGRGARWRVV